jgi:TonB-dependent receptor
MRRFLSCPFTVALTVLLSVAAGSAEERYGTIVGTVQDASHAILPGATVKLEPGTVSAVSNGQGEFTFSGVAPGAYTLTVNYVGFAPSTMNVTVTGGQVLRANPILTTPSESESIVVTAERAHGEAEAINQVRTSENILNILPAEVIMSLPNQNIADAVNRLPGVTLERDEGEGKYVQIRGTEPRLSNLTIDGVEVPSPEGGVRQVRMDTIPADLVDSVQINKTLQANQPGDAIGGSVNLVTKTAGGWPTVSLYVGQGYTSIANGVYATETAATAGQRFGADKRFGVLVSGTYDYNGRAIDDLEPVPGLLAGTTFTPGPSAVDIRQYKFNRHRYGFAGSIDYRVSDSSTLYLRGLYSDFKDFGRRFVYSLADNPVLDGVQNTNLPSFNTEARLQDFLISSLSLSGTHIANKTWLNWQLAVSHSRQLAPISGGESIALFTFAGATSNCQYSPGATTNILEPQFSPACFTEAYNPSNLQLSTISDAKYGKADQLNLQGSASAARNYQFGSNANNGILEFGANVRNGHKFDNSYEFDYTAINPSALPLSMFLGNFHNPDYYGGAYTLGPAGDWDKVLAFLRAHPEAFSVVSTQGGNAANFNLVERVWAGYLMNTVDFKHFRLVTGVRVEGTTLNSTSFDTTTNTLSAKGSSSYVDVLPSASLRLHLDQDSDMRLVFGRGLSRPDPAFVTTAVSLDTGTNPFTYSVGNPALKPEHSLSYDILYERSLHPLGLVQAGVFYKSLTDPFVQLLTTPTTGPYVGFNVNTPANGGSAYIFGVEVAFLQHFTNLPGLLSGLGLSGNYSYTTSQAKGVDPQNRTDNPALLRQAPNTWNLSPTYDRGRLSLRVGLSYNGPNIFLYTFKGLQSDGSPTPGGLLGPFGDQYLYSHFQVDAQGTFRVGGGVTLIASGLNLTNEVFGFYNGSPQFVLQREFYKPTIRFGLRWDLQKH